MQTTLRTYKKHWILLRLFIFTFQLHVVDFIFRYTFFISRNSSFHRCDFSSWRFPVPVSWRYWFPRPHHTVYVLLTDGLSILSIIQQSSAWWKAKYICVATFQVCTCIVVLKRVWMLRLLLIDKGPENFIKIKEYHNLLYQFDSCARQISYFCLAWDLLKLICPKLC